MIKEIISGLAVALITGFWTWFYKRKFSLRFRHTIRHGTVNDFFSIIQKELSEIKTLKILANISNVSLPAFQESKMNAVDVQLLLRKAHINPTEKEKKFNDYLSIVVEEWLNLQTEGRIKKLEVKYFDFLTTDWQVIIDDKFIILGLNVPKKDDWKRFQIKDTILIVGDSESGRSLIEKYSRRFDDFFSEYASKIPV